MTSQPGFRFFPTEEELVSFYLHNKLLSGGGGEDNLNRAIGRIIPVLDIYAFNPWDLPQNSGEVCNINDDPDQQWFFSIPRQESEVRGGRPNRLTTTGYWKATGSPGLIYSTNNNSVIGVKRSMVFYIGRAPNGTKTVWKMNEYKAIVASSPPPSIVISSTGVVDSKLLRQEFSLWRVYKKSKLMPAFDRRPPAPTPPVLIVDDDMQETGGQVRQPPPHFDNNINHDHASTTTDHVLCPILIDETLHHNDRNIGHHDDQGAPKSTPSHEMLNPTSSLHEINPRHENIIGDVTASSSSTLEHDHIHHNVDYGNYDDQALAAFSNWDFDWDSYWDCFNGI